MTHPPLRFRDEDQLEDVLSTPPDWLAGALAAVPGDIAVLGAAGKMGPTLALAAKRAGGGRRVIAVSRFSDAAVAQRLQRAGVEILPCDLLDREAIARLPKVPNVVFLAGRKFGTGADAAPTWAMNALVPANVCEHFAGARIVALSTGCVYPLVPSDRPCDESVPTAPVGEYAWSCLARERAFQFYAAAGRVKVCLVRLNYALEPRYGVVHDIARRLLEDQPIDRSAPSFNGIWQADANAITLGLLAEAASPASVWNVTGPETASITAVAEELGRLLKRTPRYANEPGQVGWLNDARRALGRFGYPRLTLSQIVEATAAWLADGKRSLGKPTHYAAVDGTF
jgi:nucleoside-diphosphate-sugar epimerase